MFHHKLHFFTGLVICTFAHSLFHSFALSLICSSLFRSKSLIYKSQHKQFTCDSSESVAKKEQTAWKIRIFCMFLYIVPPFYAQERVAQVAHDKRATGGICSFSQANCSFAHKKRANRSETRWAKSQPCFFIYFSCRSKCAADQSVRTVVLSQKPTKEANS